MELEKAVSVCNENKIKFNIPEMAKLNFMEKRVIELVSENEKPDRIKDVLVWVAQYYLPEKCRLYEMTINMNGEVIRID